MTQYVAGIDFGTTNSSAAISDGKEVRMVDVENGKNTIPTALFFSFDTKKIYYGRDAQAQYTNDEENGRFMCSIKSLLGTSLMQESTIINGKSTKFTTIVENFIRYLKQRIDNIAGTNVESVVMGRPVHFRDNNVEEDNQAEQTLKQIVLDAGFKNVAFQYEPIAAAFTHEQNLTSEKLAFVADIGGGTSDFSIIRLSPDKKFNFDRTEDVLANTGVHIGGNDFDKDLSMKSFMPCFGLDTKYRSYNGDFSVPRSPFFSLSTWHSVNDVYNYKTLNDVKGYVVWGHEPEKLKRLYEIIERRLGHKNLEYVERAKIALSTNLECDTMLDFLSDTPTVKTIRKSFEEAMVWDIEKIDKAVQECLANAKIKNTDIELIILTGGSTEIPYINQMMQSYFPDAKISSGNKMCSVGLGLAYDAMRRFCKNDKIR